MNFLHQPGKVKNIQAIINNCLKDFSGYDGQTRSLISNSWEINGETVHVWEARCRYKNDKIWLDARNSDYIATQHAPDQ